MDNTAPGASTLQEIGNATCRVKPRMHLSRGERIKLEYLGSKKGLRKTSMPLITLSFGAGSKSGEIKDFWAVHNRPVGTVPNQNHVAAVKEKQLLHSMKLRGTDSPLHCKNLLERLY